MQRITVTYGQPTSVEEFEEHYASTHIDLVKRYPGWPGSLPPTRRR